MLLLLVERREVFVARVDLAVDARAQESLFEQSFELFAVLALSSLDYRREDLRGAARAGNALRQLAQLPWFARNVAVKVLLTLRLRRAARLLGADGWPY